MPYSYRDSGLSRRGFLQGCAASVTAAVTPLLGWAKGEEHAPNHAVAGPAQRILPLDTGWIFAGKQGSAVAPPAPGAGGNRITLPYTVVPLSWRNWDPTAWEDVWLFQRRFRVPGPMQGMRLFLHFDRVMAGAQVSVNGQAPAAHLGGFLPFEYEVTKLVRPGENDLSVRVDSRWLNAPPSGSSRGPRSIDYLLPGGITGSVSLRAVPQIFLSNVFAKPVDVLDGKRRIELLCRVDADVLPAAPVRLTATLRYNGRRIATTAQTATLEKPDQEVPLVLGDLQAAPLWEIEDPRLCDLTVTLLVDETPVHDSKVRVGLRDARFSTEGFFLNGSRLQIFGLDRHELFPYVGFAAAPRSLRRDAELLRKSFHCNMVRCSHYPQSEAFLDRCDELGLMVWEELPGWQYIGDADWQALAVRDVAAMVRRDRNHPSVIIWGVRINESANDPELYRRTSDVAKSLDGSRPTSGTMTPSSRKNWREEWHEDVFAFDDYHSAPDGSVGIEPPVAGFPYMIAETVGQFDYATGRGFDAVYRRTGDPALQAKQALYHAEAHDRAANFPQCSGALAWCAFEYGSLMNAWESIKCPGIADVFRMPKLGASFYLAQVDPAVQPVIEPSFYWDFGPHMPDGPGSEALIFSNCEELRLYVGGKAHGVLRPARERFPHLRYAPFFADLRTDAQSKPELRIDGYVGGQRVLSRSFSADPAQDRFWLHADDHELKADGSDATRLAFAVVDRFGSPRAFGGGTVTLAVQGPGVIVGDNPFPLEDSGGVGAVWIRSEPDRLGRINITAQHSSLGMAKESVAVVRA
ncbi:MAG: glycoside hydrolase family 2 TIM barrel-domain containing protein [Acidobacteriaceae bacterium]